MPPHAVSVPELRSAQESANDAQARAVRRERRRKRRRRREVSGAECPTALVRRAQSGERRAFEVLWQRHAPIAHGILLTMVRDHEAEDLLQEVAVAAYRALPALQRPDLLPAWLCAIARNAGRDALAARRRRREAPLDAVAEEDLHGPDRGDSTVADEILEQIRALPECYREPLMLRLLLELSGPEIAARTGLTEGSVRVNLCRGMKLLRARLQRIGVEG
ncbi:MAG: sigma-70 family RNA polymerase sigma factor [Planctomycetes bacterium]|nr:sigma-70 family RNA polymerase sigma factor [Planctomycetota bacterium]